MEVPDHLQAVAGEVLRLQSVAAQRQGNWAVLYGLAPYKDGDSWCVLLGEDIQSGICAFADTPAKAIYAFEEVMNTR